MRLQMERYEAMQELVVITEVRQKVEDVPGGGVKRMSSRQVKPYDISGISHLTPVTIVDPQKIYFGCVCEVDRSCMSFEALLDVEMQYVVA
jgi:redox-regulated HSP33 family molecular chaperone